MIWYYVTLPPLRQAFQSMFGRKQKTAPVSAPKPEQPKSGVKTVSYKGCVYEVDAKPFAYTHCQFIINGETCDKHIPNDQLINVELFSQGAKSAIEEYEARHAREKAFADWDGTIK